MDTDKEVVHESDIALIEATIKYKNARPYDKPTIKPALNAAQSNWGKARYRLLFPDVITVQNDVDEARKLHERINQAADKQQLVQALFDLASLLAKFA